MSPPDYADVGYWDKKYNQNQQSFDWLVPSHTLKTEIANALKQIHHKDLKILHIGSGTSDLSFLLRELIKNPVNVCNVDYSNVAVEWGKSMEEKKVKHAQEQTPKSNGPDEPLSTQLAHRMKWVQASLLSLASVMSSLEVNSYSLVVDKSTADSIACGDEIPAEIPCPLLVSDNIAFNLSQSQTLAGLDAELLLQPIHMLALNLAYVIKPGGLWLCWSYSEHRFKFLQPSKDDAIDFEAILAEAGYPDIRKLWNVEHVTTFEAAQSTIGTNDFVHRPAVMHYYSKVRRTNVKLELRSDFLPFPGP